VKFDKGTSGQILSWESRSNSEKGTGRPNSSVNCWQEFSGPVPGVTKGKFLCDLVFCFFAQTSQFSSSSASSTSRNAGQS
jgi:hypothetical protein